jgi:hypothetical protein
VNDQRGANQRHRSLESRLEIERLTSGLEGGCWKSAYRVTRWQSTLPHVRFCESLWVRLLWATLLLSAPPARR